MIPDFDENGNLPEGIWEATIEEVKKKYAYNSTRKRIFEGLCKAIEILKANGCVTLYLDGRYICDRESPSDFDACIERTEASEWLKQHLFPTRIDFEYDRIQQINRYKGEFRYANEPEHFDQDQKKYITFLEYYQQDDRHGKLLRKGILKIKL